MIFIFFISIVAGILMGITESINKSITEKQYSSFSYFFIQVFFNMIFFSVPFLIWGIKIISPLIFFYLILIAVFLFLGNLFIIKAYKTEDISNLNILSKSSLVVAFFSGIISLKEKATQFDFMGIFLIILGILLIFYEGKRLSISRGLMLGLTSGILAGLATYFRKLTLEFLNPVSVVFFMQIIIFVMLIFVPKTLKDIKPILLKYKKKIFLSRITAVVGIYLFIWTLSKGNISVINTNYETSFLLSTSLIGILLMNEKKYLTKKIGGAALCILGIILLNFF